MARIERQLARSEKQVAELKLALEFVKANPGYTALSSVLGRVI